MDNIAHEVHVMGKIKINGLQTINCDTNEWNSCDCLHLCLNPFYQFIPRKIVRKYNNHTTCTKKSLKLDYGKDLKTCPFFFIEKPNIIVIPF